MSGSCYVVKLRITVAMEMIHLFLDLLKIMKLILCRAKLNRRNFCHLPTCAVQVLEKVSRSIMSLESWGSLQGRWDEVLSKLYPVLVSIKLSVAQVLIDWLVLSRQ